MRKNNNILWRFLYKLHRYIGLFSALIFIMLAVTGIALNHTEDLKLDSQMIQSKTLLDWYGIKPPEQLKSFATTQHWLTQLNQQIYFDNTLLFKKQEALLGAVETDQFIVVAFNNSLLLLSLAGETIEQMPLDSVEAIGLDTEQQIVIKSGFTVISSNDDLLSWHPHNNKPVKWSKTAHPPKSIKQSIQDNFRSTILPAERVILDIHSGRFFGFIGVIIVDISGVFLIILSLSGCAIWFKHKLRAFHRSRID